ncbi:MAG: hypothetical protein J0J04_01275 [Microbacterium sp.]|nr:hypothetical protein [Microbacterium sp.]OJV85080.1 MAG: hypothetical protein BGO46_10880 [Microbacterium sp. 70-16]
MDNRNTHNRIASISIGGLLLVAAALGGAALGTVASSAPQHADAATPTEIFPSTGAPDRFEVNENGQTVGEYGIGLQGDPSADPELILAVGEGGVEGYVYTRDVFGEPAVTLDEAARVGSPTRKVVPLYERDGETVIGTYIANGGY